MVLLTPDPGAFSTGTSSLPAGNGMEKSLDEIIRDRRKDQVKESRSAPKKPSTADRSIATGRAKREAATKARRGMSDSKRPEPAEVKREVYRQARRTEESKQKNEQKATQGRLPPKAKPSRDRKKKETKSAPAVFGGQTPSKKAIEAAVKGMEASGFKVPPNMQVVITFVPLPESFSKPAAKQSQQPNNGRGQKPGNNQNAGGQNKQAGQNKQGGRRGRK